MKLISNKHDIIRKESHLTGDYTIIHVVYVLNSPEPKCKLLLILGVGSSSA